MSDVLEHIFAQPKTPGTPFETPPHLPGLADEIKQAMCRWNVLTTDSRMKVLSALEKASVEEREASETERQERMHQRVLDEIVTSERSYLRQLELLQEFFVKPIQERQLLPKNVFAAVFGSLQSIYHVNRQFLSDLLAHPNRVGKVFLDYAPYLKLYSTYANEYLEASTMLEEWRRKNRDLERLLHNQETRPEVQQRIDSLLITPIQRVPRYCLLLEQLKNKLPRDHPEYATIEKAVGQVNHVARYLEGRINDHRNMQKMLRLQRALLDGRPRIMLPGRRFIREGTLLKVSQRWGTTQQRYFLLFNDMLLSCRARSDKPIDSESLVCCRLLPLRHCSVHSVVGRGMFKITCREDSLLLCATSPEEGEAWCDCLKEAIRQYKSCHQTLRKESSSKRPLRRAAIAVLRHESLTEKFRKRRRELLAKKRKRSQSLMSAPQSALSECNKMAHNQVLECVTPHKKPKMEATMENNKENVPPYGEAITSTNPYDTPCTSQTAPVAQRRKLGDETFAPQTVSTPIVSSSTCIHDETTARFTGALDSLLGWPRRAAESLRQGPAKNLSCSIQ